MLSHLFYDNLYRPGRRSSHNAAVIGVSLLGLVVAKVYQFKTVYSKSFGDVWHFCRQQLPIVIFLVNGSHKERGLPSWGPSA